MDDLWRWPYEPELDKHGTARVPIPEKVRPFTWSGREVELLVPGGGVLKGVVTEFSRNSWIARVKVKASA